MKNNLKHQYTDSILLCKKAMLIQLFIVLHYMLYATDSHEIVHLFEHIFLQIIKIVILSNPINKLLCTYTVSI